MMLNTVDDYSIKYVTIQSTISVVTAPILLLYITYFDSLYGVGKYTAIHIPAFIIAVEIIKLYLSTMRNSSSFSGRDNKTVKKSYMKIKMKEIFKCLLLILSTVTIYYVIAVLFGAEIFEKSEETLMLSIIVASLTVVPSCLNLGAEQTISFLVGKYTSSNPISDMIMQSILLTFFGTWLGAITIPLDWERPWQKWPIPCYLGALLGNIVACILTLIKLLPSIVKVYTGKSLKINKFYDVKSKM